MPKILIAPNCFRQVLNSSDLSGIIEQAFLNIFPSSTEIISMPFADGGDNSLDIFKKLLDLNIIRIETLNCKHEPIHAEIGIYKDKAIIEASEVIGLRRVDGDLKPLISDSKGLGIIIEKILNIGIRKFVFLLGGSAIIDLGIGMYKHLGLKLLVNESELAEEGILNFINVKRIHNDIDERFLSSHISLYCDIDGSLKGVNNIQDYYMQKGVSKSQIPFVNKSIENLINCLDNDFRDRIAFDKYTASNGGLASMVKYFNNCSLYSGSAIFAKLYRLDSVIRQSDIVVTGEGIFDKQSLTGKGAFFISQLARKYNKKVIAIIGKSEDTNLYNMSEYFDLVIENPIDLENENSQKIISKLIHKNILNNSSRITKLL